MILELDGKVAMAKSSVSTEVELSSLIKKRSVYKRKVTMALKEAETCDGRASVLNALLDQVNANLGSVSEMDGVILDRMIEGESTDENINYEADKQLEYTNDVKIRLNVLKSSEVDKKNDCALPIAKDIKLPHLKVPTFNGEGDVTISSFCFL